MCITSSGVFSRLVVLCQDDKHSVEEQHYEILALIMSWFSTSEAVVNGVDSHSMINTNTLGFPSIGRFYQCPTGFSLQEGFYGWVVRYNLF